MTGKIDGNSKIAFFVKEGLDNFINDIIVELSKNFETKKIIVSDYSIIDEEMEWADISWFEWCDELLIYGSKLDRAQEKTIICRLHSYEIFTNYPSSVNWNAVNKLIVVANHIKTLMVKEHHVDSNKIEVIANGIDIEKYSFKKRKPGFNIASVGYINYKKGPMLLLQAFKSIYERDNRYKLYIAGKFQDGRYVLYLRQMIIEMGLSNNVIYEGWVDDIDKWLEDKEYIICSSVFESQNLSVMEAMAKGIKPLIHNFVGARNIYKGKYIWNTIGELLDIIKEDYDSREYRDFVKNYYYFEEKTNKIRKLLESEFKNNDKNDYTV
ncbi:hypothetical protein SH1V18_32860 [Vallitalea longa]|uniref:Glycosyl transferase family 1 domain-containing protein n=1 Tax=Vallitalea longa TaxID=2936439 RepID=A0A9W5YDT7_9FIRM|nr:glycosyltransferase family 4 protein [Vallitalea longa]GKX30806.1 hypothetical protein SH1V18_32860 [Vallitalea longa]